MPDRALENPDIAARQLPQTNAIPSLELFHSSLPEPARLPTADRSVSSARGFAVFLQEHALKIVFALATVLVLIALRSILGWDKTNGAFLALLPALPIALTVMFRHFGGDLNFPLAGGLGRTAPTAPVAADGAPLPETAKRLGAVTNSLPGDGRRGVGNRPCLDDADRMPSPRYSRPSQESGCSCSASTRSRIERR